VVSRRKFLAAGLAALPGIAGLPGWLFADDTATRVLSFSHTHTGEQLGVEYFAAGSYLPGALDEINYFLRDFRTGDVHQIDPGLLDILYQLKRKTGGSSPFQVISGYRCAATNAMLRQWTTGVAGNSLHMEGRAIDIRLPGVPLRRLRNAALRLQLGGVGYYAASQFVHVDTGRVRRW
jgi:uncharacterized protein YcbK (DUF882 family)